MINYTWTVDKLFTKKVQDKENYVVIVNYTVKGEDGNNSFEVKQIVNFNTENVDSFIDFNNLTNDIVVGWIKQSLGEGKISNIENLIKTRIERDSSNAVFNPLTPATLPWINNG